MAAPNYRTYIQSDEWRARKAAWPGGAKAVRGKCFCCRAEGRLEFHHLSYRNLGDERNHQLKPLCRSCHQGVHDYAKESGRGLYTATWAYRKIVQREQARTRRVQSRVAETFEGVQPTG